MRPRWQVPLTLSIAAALIAAACWMGSAGCERPDTPAIHAPPAAAAVTAVQRAKPNEPLTDDASGASRAAAGDVARLARHPVAAPYRRPVRVYGRVQRGDHPLALVDVSFERITGQLQRSPGDWDLTDANGSYEVRLSAARYAVLHEDEAWIATVEIPPGQRELRLDLFVP